VTRAEVTAAVVRAAEAAEAWRRALTPEAGEPWDALRSRDLDAADDALARLRVLAADLEGQP
jgi:hypothetical protein